MAKRRAVGNSSNGIQKWFAEEDGKHYRGQIQQMDDVFNHVAHLDDKVNSAPKSGNQQEWEYVGSIPMTLLTDWLAANHYTWPQYATNEDGAKDKFKKFIMSRQHHKLLAKDALRRHG